MNDELNKLIDDIILKKGGTRKDYRLLMDKIGYHESRLNPKSVQKGGGPGRGKYQFEIGRYKGGKTAANRAINYYKKNKKSLPQWLKKLDKFDSVDASKLTPSQQDILFLTNMMEHPKANFKKIIDGDENIEDFWANYHWAGNNINREDRIKSFNESMSTFEPSLYSNKPYLKTNLYDYLKESKNYLDQNQF